MSSSTRFASRISDEKGMTEIATIVARKIGRLPTKEELGRLRLYVTSQAIRNWSMQTDREIFQILADNWTKDYFTVKGREKMRETKVMGTVDMHEIMKLQIGATDSDPTELLDQVDPHGIPITRVIKTADPDLGPQLGSLDQVKSVASIGAVNDITRILGISDKATIQALFNPDAGLRCNYINLDSKNRLTDSDGTTEYSWNFLNNSAELSPGAVNSLGNVKNIVEIQISEFRFPWIESMHISSLKRATMLIKEFSAQSFIGNPLRYHFMFKTEVDDNSVNMIPLLTSGGSETGSFKFAKPITQMDKITVSFGNPLNPVVMHRDRQFVNITYTATPTFTTADGLPHNLQTADQVIFSSFTTGDPIGDQKIIDQVNDENGHNIFVPDETTFQIDDLDLSSIVTPAAGPFEVYYGSKRVVIQLKLIYIQSTSARVAE